MKSAIARPIDLIGADPEVAVLAGQLANRGTPVRWDERPQESPLPRRVRLLRQVGAAGAVYDVAWWPWPGPSVEEARAALRDLIDPPRAPRKAGVP